MTSLYKVLNYALYDAMDASASGCSQGPGNWLRMDGREGIKLGRTGELIMNCPCKVTRLQLIY